MTRLLALTGSVSAARADDAGDEAVAFVTKSKGNFSRDDKVPGKPIVRVDRSAAIKVTEAGLKELAPLKNLAAPIL